LTPGRSPATTRSGLPNLNAMDFTIAPAFAADCPTKDMDCGAETTILAYFVNPFVGGFNAKATQTSGMEASRDSLTDLGIAGVKLVSQATQGLCGTVMPIRCGGKKGLRPPRIKSVRIVMALQQFRAHSQAR
jgi:hypothetical protein